MSCLRPLCATSRTHTRWLSLFCLFVMTCAGSCLAEESAYVREIDQWHAERLASLKKPTGWLSLAGLFWLKDGAQSVGSHTSSDVVFPSDMPEHLGVITWQDGVVAFEPEKEVFSGGEAMRKQVLAVDTTGEPTVLTWGTYHWYVIVRGQQYGIRLRNTRHPNLDQFDGIDRFAVDGAWKLGAQFEAYDPPKTVEIPTVLGTISSEICPGRLLFEVDGRNYTLEPLGDMNEEEWFVIFGDETNG
ncbi:MAG: DUF1684 domain-containing protein, partial [bacterium]|nr:DUF1684 domain-containing protein [bacterium]